MDNKIQELVRLYHKDFEAVDEGNAISCRKLTFEEIQKNKRTAMEMLLTLPKEQLVDYIFGKQFEFMNNIKKEWVQKKACKDLILQALYSFSVQNLKQRSDIPR